MKSAEKTYFREDLENMTVIKLKALAKSKDVAISVGTRKAEIVDALVDFFAPVSSKVTREAGAEGPKVKIGSKSKISAAHSSCHFCKEKAVRFLKHSDGDLKLCPSHANRVDSLTFLIRDNKLDPNDFKFLEFSEIKSGDRIFEGFDESVKTVKKIWEDEEDEGRWHLTCIDSPYDSFHDADEINAILKAPSKEKKSKLTAVDVAPIKVKLTILGEPQLFTFDQVKKMMKVLGSDEAMSLENVIRLNNLFWQMLSLRFLSYRGYRFFTATSESLDFLLDGELARHGVAEGIKATVSQGKQLIIKPSSDLQVTLETLRGTYGQNIQFPKEDALPYFAAVLQYLLTEILELAINNARDEEREEVIWEDVETIVEKDVELAIVFGRKKNILTELGWMVEILSSNEEQTATGKKGRKYVC